jgi:predicted ATPase/transcriptional regulator with XRE-family HTH domain
MLKSRHEKVAAEQKKQLAHGQAAAMNTPHAEPPQPAAAGQATFGALLRHYRLAAGLSQEELAERAGLSVQGLSALENGRRQTLYRHTVTLLAKAMNLPASDAAALETAIVRVRATASVAAPALGDLIQGTTHNSEPTGDASPPGQAPQPARTNLPVQPTSFLGRERELGEVRALLGQAPLVTLTGAGGAGKTRLALAVSGDVINEYADGGYLVELAPLVDPTLVMQTVATALGLREEPNRPLLATIIDHLKARRLLLVLDNCKHLIDVCAELATALLRSCPHLRILATSRETLEVPGESIYRVPSLTLPDFAQVLDPEHVGASAAVQLFVQRAWSRRPDFMLNTQNAAIVAEVCTRLDGMPLAIELAAARVGSLPVEGIAKRLDDRFRLLTGGSRTVVPRQQTLRAALDWSYDLLDEPERVLLRRLSVFACGWALEAAETVCAGDVIDGLAILDLLDGLVNKSLVVLDAGGPTGVPERYRLLETVRQYGRERLETHGEEPAVRDRHLAWCVALAEEAAAQMTGPEQGQWLDRLEREHDNLLTALGWARERGMGEEGLRLAGALWSFWWPRGYFSEAHIWLAAALASGGSSAARARALTSASFLASEQGDNERAAILLEESLALRRALGDKPGIADSLSDLGWLAFWQGDGRRAATLLEEGLALQRALGDRRSVANSLITLGWIVCQRGEHARAGPLIEEGLALWRELGDTAGIALALHTLGWIAFWQGEYGRAAALLEEALTLLRNLGHAPGSALALDSLGRVAHVQGAYGRAVALVEESLSLRRELGHRWGIANSLHNLGRLAYTQGEYRRAAALQEEGLLLSSNINARDLVADGLEGLACVAAARRLPQRAALLGGAAETLREALGIPLTPDKRADHEQAVQAIRVVLGEGAFAAAWAEGRALPLDEAIALALVADQTPAERSREKGTDAPIVKCCYQLAATPCEAGHRGRATLRLGRDGERHPCCRLRADGGERSERTVAPPSACAV